MLYFNQSIYIHSHIETPHGVRRLGRRRHLAVPARDDASSRSSSAGSCNPWGHHFDRWGQSFATDGAGGEGINYVFPGAYYVTAPGAVRILQGLNPGSPKYCGLEIVSGRHLPDDWQGNLITNDFRGHRVCRFVLERRRRRAIASREQPELIKTKHVAFRPIDVKMGPDGAIYIADWYNPIIQHGEVDFRDPRRDHTHGRIWRVTAKGRPLVERPKLVGAPTADSARGAEGPRGLDPAQAKRVLKERGRAEVVPALAAWVKALDPADPDVEHQRLEGLWTYQALDVVEPDLLATLLDAAGSARAGGGDAGGPALADRLSDPLALLADRVADDHPRVRLEAVRALAQVPERRVGRGGAAGARPADRPVPRLRPLADGARAGAAGCPRSQAGRLDFGGDARHLVFALEAVGSPAVVRPAGGVAPRRARSPRSRRQGVLTLVADARRAGGPGLGLRPGRGRRRDAAPAQRRALLDALAQATRQRKVRPGRTSGRLGRWLDAGDEALRVAAAAGGRPLEGRGAARRAPRAIARSAETTSTRSGGRRSTAWRGSGGRPAARRLERARRRRAGRTRRGPGRRAPWPRSIPKAAAPRGRRLCWPSHRSRHDVEASSPRFLQRKDGPGGAGGGPGRQDAARRRRQARRPCRAAASGREDARR